MTASDVREGAGGKRGSGAGSAEAEGSEAEAVEAKAVEAGVAAAETGGLGLRGGTFGDRLTAFLRGRGPLVVILLLQVVLAYQLSNTAFEDESLYLYAGHRELALELHGTPTYDSYPSYFSGAPFLYPIMVAWLDSLGGLEAARALSLVCLLVTTGIIWTLTRRLYGRAPSILASALFATSAPTLFLSRFATYDAMTILLLAIAFWIVVRTVDRSPALVLAAAPVLALAVAVKYAALLYVPTVVGVAGLSEAAVGGRALGGKVFGGRVLGGRAGAWRRGMVRAVLLGAGGAGLLVAGYASLSPAMKLGITQTTTNRDVGGDPVSAIVRLSMVWCGWVFVLAVVGTGFEVVRGWGRGRAQAGGGAGAGARGAARARVLLAATLAGTALLATVYQAHLHKMQSLHKHLGFGLMFAAPVAGLAIAGLARLQHRDVRRRVPGLALGVVGVLALYAGHAVRPMYEGWPDSSGMVDFIRPLVHEGREQHYLAEENEVPRYYLRDRTQPYEWFTTFFFSYTSRDGRQLSGVEAYRAALGDHYFNLVILDHGPTAGLDQQLDETLKAAGSGYRLLGAVPGRTSHGVQVYEVWGVG